jgi:hypothetical protein
MGRSAGPVRGYTYGNARLLGADQDDDGMLTRQVRYWESVLAGVAEQLELPFDRSRPAFPSYRGGQVEVQIDAGLHAGLAGLAVSIR